MLSWDEVLRYIHYRLNLPTNFIEKTDSEIKEYLLETAHQEFSNYFPDSKNIVIKTNDPKFIHPTKKNCYLIKDPDNLKILGLKECLFRDGLDIVGAGGLSTLVDPVSFSAMPRFALDTFMYKSFKSYSPDSALYKFYPPNEIQLYISEGFDIGDFTAIYEREQPRDLSLIPPTLHMAYKDLCLAECMIWIGNLRSLFVNLNSPFGEIPINGQELKSNGEELKNKIIELLEDNSRPPIYFESY